MKNDEKIEMFTETSFEAFTETDLALGRIEQAAKLLECFMQWEADKHTTAEIIEAVMYSTGNILKDIEIAKQSLNKC